MRPAVGNFARRLAPALALGSALLAWLGALHPAHANVPLPKPPPTWLVLYQFEREAIRGDEYHNMTSDVEQRDACARALRVDPGEFRLPRWFGR